MPCHAMPYYQSHVLSLPSSHSTYRILWAMRVMTLVGWLKVAPEAPTGGTLMQVLRPERGS